MKNLSLAVAATCMCWAATAQWTGPSGGILRTVNAVVIEQSGSTVGGTGTTVPPLFETRLTGFPTTGPNAVPGGTVSPFCVTYSGKVGVGTNTPQASLDIVGTLRAANRTTGQAYLQTFERGNLTLTTDGNPVNRGLFIKSPTGDIFTVTPDGILFTDGTMELFKVDATGQLYGRKMIVTLSNPFPDYVFEENYQLMPLKNLAAFIEANKHLPNLPSAADIAANNKQVELGEMQLLLLEKVEELTLYILQQQQQIEELQRKLDSN